MTENNLTYPTLSHKLAAKLSLSISLLFTLVLFAGLTFGNMGENAHNVNDTHPVHHIHHVDEVNVWIWVVIQFLTYVSTFFLLYEFCFWLLRKTWKNRVKHWVALFGTIGVAIPISLALSTLVILCYRTLPNDLHQMLVIVNYKSGVAIALVVFLSSLYLSIFVRNQQARIENQRLLTENIRNRHEALKNQINPHYLFNSLNTLDGLIGFDDEKAHLYLQNLSSTFRYTIQNKEITTLKEELDFVASYVYLMNIRYGENLSIQYAIDEAYNRYYVMPISLQMLIENAIKHNVINDRHPLTIHLETTTHNTIKVSNAIQPKINAEPGAGIGLANLSERYRLLFGMDVAITKTDVFTVEIPLIHNPNEGRHS